MKKIAYVGQIVGKYTKNIWENGKKTDDSKKIHSAFRYRY